MSFILLLCTVLSFSGKWDKENFNIMSAIVEKLDTEHLDRLSSDTLIMLLQVDNSYAHQKDSARDFLGTYEDSLIVHITKILNAISKKADHLNSTQKKYLQNALESTIDDLVRDEKFGKTFQLLKIIHETEEKSGDKFIVNVAKLSVSLRGKSSSISRDRNNNTRKEAFKAFKESLQTVGIKLFSDSDMQQYYKKINTNRR